MMMIMIPCGFRWDSSIASGMVDSERVSDGIGRRRQVVDVSIGRLLRTTTTGMVLTSAAGSRVLPAIYVSVISHRLRSRRRNNTTP